MVFYFSDRLRNLAAIGPLPRQFPKQVSAVGLSMESQMITTDIRFERLIDGLAPVLDEVVEPKKEGNDLLAKRTYVVETFTGLVYFPAGVVYKDMPATEDKPAYAHAAIGGAHIHLLEGATAEMIEEGAVSVELRIRTVEPISDREGLFRNYEVVLRITPNVEDNVATKQLWLEPAENNHRTKVDERRGVLIHKGADLLMQDYDENEAQVAEQIAAAAQ